MAATQIKAREFAPRWAMGAIAVGLAGMLLLVAIRQRYDAPRREPSTAVATDVPDQLPPAMAGALAANGAVSVQHAMAALFALADRGHVSVAEGSRRFGQRTFTLKRMAKSGRVAPHEQTLLDVIFRDKHGAVDTTDLSKARTQLTRGFRAFANQSSRSSPRPASSIPSVAGSAHSTDGCRSECSG